MNSGIVREDQYGKGSVNHKIVGVIGERHLTGRLKSQSASRKERNEGSKSGAVDEPVWTHSRTIFKLNMNIIRGQ